MFWSQRSVVLVAAVSAVILSDFIAARSSYDGKRQKIPNLLLNHYLNKLCITFRLNSCLIFIYIFSQCYVDATSGAYVCHSTGTTACVQKSCLATKICCGDGASNKKYSCEATASKCV